jgi:hypothetical protein
MPTKVKLKIVNPETGELLSPKSPVQDLSDARKFLVMKQKELEQQISQIDEVLEPLIETAIENGEKKLCNFWTLVRGSSRFNKDAFAEKAPGEVFQAYTLAKGEIKLIEDNEEYKVQGKAHLAFPKFI